TAAVGAVGAEPVARHVPLGDLLLLFQGRFPVWAAVAAGVLALATGIRAGRLSVRYGFYQVPTALVVPLYGAVACGILAGPNYLPEFASSYVLLLSLQHFCAGFRNGYAIGAFFRGAFCLGLLPLLCAYALPLPLLLLPAAVCLRRTLRETFVALCGGVLPLAGGCYADWALGAEPFDLLRRLWSAFLEPGGFRLFGQGTVLVPVVFGVVLFIVVCAVAAGAAGFRTQSRKARGMLTYVAVLLGAVALLGAVPSVTAGIFSLAAAPAALLMPLALVRVRREWAALLYSLLYGLSFVNILLYSFVAI
ncbi:MAG: hypothetical protein K2O63_06135, partial [Alistipes sp.]|nr:hypothetical protein [Alistipes sp.]